MFICLLHNLNNWAKMRCSHEMSLSEISHWHVSSFSSTISCCLHCGYCSFLTNISSSGQKHHHIWFLTGLFLICCSVHVSVYTGSIVTPILSFSDRDQGGWWRHYIPLLAGGERKWRTQQKIARHAFIIFLFADLHYETANKQWYDVIMTDLNILLLTYKL